MKHEVSKSDLEFLAAFEAGAYAPADFSHRAHVRLAYVYLATNDVERATYLMRGAIVNFLRHHGIAPTKYHETLTQAWILAVFHFMHRTTSALSADDFIDAHAAAAGQPHHAHALQRRAAVLAAGARRVRGAGPGSDSAPRGVAAVTSMCWLIFAGIRGLPWRSCRGIQSARLQG